MEKVSQAGPRIDGIEEMITSGGRRVCEGDVVWYRNEQWRVGFISDRAIRLDGTDVKFAKIRKARAGKVLSHERFWWMVDVGHIRLKED